MLYYVIGSMDNGDKRKFYSQYSTSGEFRPDLITKFHQDLSDPRNERAWLIAQDEFMAKITQACQHFEDLRLGRIDIDMLPEELE